MTSKFINKVVIVTGASSGIGAATAVAFAKEGARLVVCGRNEDRLEETAKLCQKNGAEVLKITGDLAVYENLETVITKTIEKFSSIDILINNAGITQLQKPISDMTVDEYDHIFKINARAPVFLSKFAFPYLKKTKGCIVNVSSMTSLKAFPTITAYAMTKSALDHFTRCFASECVSYGIRVNSINPGIVKTGINDVFHTKEQADEILAWAETSHPLGVLESEAVAEGIVYLCSSPHITGINLPIDSGCLIKF